MNKNITFLLLSFTLIGCSYTKEFGADAKEQKSASSRPSFDEAVDSKSTSVDEQKKKDGLRFTPVLDTAKCISDMTPRSSDKYVNCKPE